MEVCLIERKMSSGIFYQIMTRAKFGFNHIFPGVLFSLEDAVEKCNEKQFRIIAVGDTWQCL